MATNNIKPFATSGSANVLTDEQLASRPELASGFIINSKADSALIGKLIQNATAGAYALGALTIKYSSTDVSGADADGFATAFETALTKFVSQKAPPPDLSDYATLASPAFTGTPTLNGVNIATVDDVPEVASKANQLVSQEGAALATAANKLVQITNGVPVESTATVGSATKPVYINAGTFTEAGTTLDVSISGTAAKATADAAGNNIADTYATQSALTSGLAAKLDSTTAASTYATQESVTSGLAAKLDSTTAASTYATQTALTQGLAEKLDADTASTTYATKTEAQALMPKAGGTFTGAVSVPAPTASSHAATKAYVDSAIASVYKYRGSVANQAALPQSDRVVGDVYNVEDTGDNYAWDGTQWDKLAGTVDLSAYLTKTDAASTYALITTVTALTERVTTLETQLAALTTTVNSKANATNPVVTGTLTIQ